jgi:vanillate O-demethylase ferredoxin subunit
MNTLAVRVDKITHEAEGIASYELVASDGAPMPTFTPGSHIDVHIGPGLVRQYSLCNSPEQLNHYLIAVKREPTSRGGSAALHERVKAGDFLTISTPRNNFRLDPSAKHHLLLGAGIGITPLLSMAQHMLASGMRFQMKYFSRSIAHTAFHGLLSEPRFKDKVEFQHALDVEGTRNCLRKILAEHAEGTHVYLCGPRPFMDLVESLAADTWPPESVHMEYFAADSAALSASTSAFIVQLARSGGTFVIPEDMSICQVLANAGVSIPTACERGVCGTCLTGVLAGSPDHRDAFLLGAERDATNKICPCVSRSRSPVLVLDL